MSSVSLFEADGTVDLDDRQHLLGLYSGIAFGAPVEVVAGTQTPMGARSIKGQQRLISRSIG